MTATAAVTTPEARLCSHCLLPLGRLATRREVDGEDVGFCCYGCYLAWRVHHGRAEESDAAWLLIRLGIGAFLAMNLMLFTLLDYTRAFETTAPELRPFVHLLLWVLATGVWLTLGGPLLREAGRDLMAGRIGATALICLGSGAAYTYSAVSVVNGGPYVYFDVASALLVLFTLGRLLEAFGRAGAVRSLTPMLEAERQWAMVAAEGGEIRRPVASVRVGERVVVHPGERIPVDGLVVTGRAMVDEAVLTGESRLAAKQPGAAVFAGSLDRDGVLVIRTTAAGAATRWAQICRAVRDSLGEDTPLRRLGDRIAAVFVPVVLVVAVLTCLSNPGEPFHESLLRGLAVLAVACPCALGLATPMALTLGIGRLARKGCVVRGGGVLERLAQLRGVAFDKTGTLTAADPTVAAIEAFGGSERDVLRRAAAVVRQSGHVLGNGIAMAALERGLNLESADDVRVVPGSGVTASVDGETVIVGRGEWLRELGWPPPPEPSEAARAMIEAGATAAYVGWGGSVRGVILLEARLNAQAAATVRELESLGLSTLLLTGDHPAAAARMAREAGVAQWQAGLSPDGKRRALADWGRRVGPVAMVGDGINDGPVLAQASVGVAVGSATDLARETADLILPPDGLARLPWAIRLARTVRRTIALNLAWAFGYNLIAIALAVQGMLPPILAAALMAGSSVIVILNSLRVETEYGP